MNYFTYRILGSCALYDIMFFHTKSVYEDFISNIDDEMTFETMEQVSQAVLSIQQGFGTFLFIQISENAIFFTIWTYLSFVEFTYGITEV